MTKQKEKLQELIKKDKLDLEDYKQFAEIILHNISAPEYSLCSDGTANLKFTVEVMKTRKNDSVCLKSFDYDFINIFYQKYFKLK